MEPTAATKNCNKPHKNVLYLFLYHCICFVYVLLFILFIVFYTSLPFLVYLLFILHTFISFVLHLLSFFSCVFCSFFNQITWNFYLFRHSLWLKLFENPLNSFFEFPSFLAFFFKYLAYIWFVSDLEKCPSSQLKVFAQL